MLIAICSGIGGLVIGLTIALLARREKPAGTLMVRYDDGEPYLFLALDRDVNDVLKLPSVTLRVENNPSNEA